MKKIIFYLVIILFTFLNCQTKNDKKDYTSDETKNINKIISAIVVQDTLDILKRTKNAKMFCEELKRMVVEIPFKQKDGSILPPVSDNIYINTILNDKIKGEVFFSTKDSAYLMYQNLYPKKFKLDKLYTSEWNLTSFEKEMIKRKEGKEYDYYEMTIPIFSKDQTKAYIEIDYHCGSLCGYGRGMYLQKVNEKWIIVETFRTWIS